MEICNKTTDVAYSVKEETFSWREMNMRRQIPGSGRSSRILLEVALVAFGLGIFVTFFLSARILVLIEAILIVAAGALCLLER